MKPALAVYDLQLHYNSFDAIYLSRKIQNPLYRNY
jgi:hypothetical protein